MGFWHDADTPAPVRAVELEGWMDVLQTCSHPEIRAAWAEYQRSGPRTRAGRLYKPDAGAIYKLVVKARPAPRPQLEPEPLGHQPTEEERERMAAFVDDTLRRLGAKR